MHSGLTHERCANFRHGKKKTQKRGEFITPPHPTGRRSNKPIPDNFMMAINDQRANVDGTEYLRL